MNIKIVSNKPWHKEPALWFQEGLKRHGVEAPIISQPEECDLLVCWGMNVAKRVRCPFLLMERAYLGDRNTWVSLGYNGLNGKADFKNKNSPSDRWEKHFSGLLQPWSRGDHILLALQIPGDHSLEGVNVNYPKIISNLKKLGYPIKIRKHPARPSDLNIKDSQITFADHQEPILEQVQKARALVAISSNTSVDAMISGTAVLNFSPYSMVWDLAMKEYEEILAPPTPDRTQWAYNMAYTQWLPEEIRNGEAWEHLKII